uniref:PNO1 protein n=1 Tax=Pavo cristatus TaxID=9049 RepID=A0A8C9FTV7_PAVCR
AAVAMETEAADESGFTSVASKRGRRKRRAAGAEPMEAAESAEAAGPQPSKRPAFPPLPAAALGVGKGEVRKVPVPANRYTPLKENWMKIFTPIVEHLQLQIRFNLKTRNVEIKVSAAPCIVMFLFLLSLMFY